MKKAFISYSHDDWDRAVRVNDALTAIGWSAFLDKQTLPPGIPWREALRTELSSSDLLIIVLTKAWVNADFTIAELEAYVKEGRRASKEVTPIIPLEFEMATDYLIPQLDKHQIVKDAAALSDHELRWMLHCGINNMAPGPRSQWAARGRDLITEPPLPPPPPSRLLNAAERLQLENELSHIQSPQRIREIGWKTLGSEVELPENPEIAWYKLIKIVNEAGLIARLCEVAGVDYERLFGPSRSSKDSESGSTNKQ